MTPDERDQIIHEALGKCWHEWEPHKSHWNCCGFATCKKCGVNTDREERDYQEKYQNPDYSKWEYYGPMLEEIKKVDWYQKFWEWLWKDEEGEEFDTFALWAYVGFVFPAHIFHNPIRGSTAIAEFLKERK